MLNTTDSQKLKVLAKQNPEIQILIEKLMKEYEFILSKMSHEIRNPLTLVYSSLQLMEAQHPQLTKSSTGQIHLRMSNISVDFWTNFPPIITANI